MQFGDVPMHQLTYYVITNDGKLALKAKEPASRAQGEPSQPTAILPPWARSPLLNVEDYSYYMQATDNGDGTYTLDPDDRTTLLTGLPTDIVYVRYDYKRKTCPLQVKDTYFGEDVPPRYFPFDLTGNTCYNIVYYSWGSDFWYTQEKSWQGNVDDSPHVLDRPSKADYDYKDGNFLFQGEKPYLWKMLGNDPYAITIKNAFKGNNKWLTATPYADNESLEPLLTNNTDADIQSFMLLKHNGMLILAATGHLNLAFNNGRWSSEYGSKWLRWHSEVDESLEDPLTNFSGHEMEFFKAPMKRNYTFHAMRFDNDNKPLGEQWSATLSRDMLSDVVLENDITRLFAKYEQEYMANGETPNVFKNHNAIADVAQFYSNVSLTQRLYDEGTDTYDIYPEIEEDATYDIYFKYKIDDDDANALAAIASTTDDIQADIDLHEANGRLDQEHIRAKWWMMDMIDSREEPATEKFLRREDNGSVDWMDNGYAFHADKTENYNSWTYHRLAEWYREGDNDAFREGRWLWAFVGEDPYNMRLLNLETAVGVSAEGEGVYTLKAADNCWVTASTTETGEEDRTAYVYNVKLPAAEPSTNMTWGLCEGDGTDNTLTLQLPITTATEQKDALYWQLAQEKKNDVVVADSIAGKTEGSVIRLLRYVPVKYEDVNLVIRRDDEVAAYQAASAIDKPDVLASMTTGISKLYFAASDRTYEAGDKIDMTDPETLPLNVRRAFCNYKLYSDVFTTIGGTYTIKAGPNPTTTQKTTTGAWRKDGEGNFVKDASGNYIYDANGGDPVFDEDGKEVWVYTSDGTFSGTPYEDGAQSIYASYTVTTDMFLKSAPNKTEVEKMANNNDHVFFIDFPGDSDDDEAHHAYYDPDATFYDQTGDLKSRTDANTGQARSEKRVWDSTAHDFVDDKTLWYNHYQWRTANDRMVSVPERLKWYFVGDPYKLQVYCTAGPWNTAALKDKDGQEIKKSDGVTVKYPANTVAANLCRFDRSETNFEFVVDCVHLRLPDYSNIDTREKVSRTDEYGNALEELHNRHYQQPYFDEFFWECVPAATDDPQAFALRFKEDNDLLGYRNVYYYLSHDGLSKTYLTDGKHESYKVNLNYRPNNERHQDGTYKGYHVANDESTVIKLVQPVKVYVSAFGNVATGSEKSENRKNTEGSMASTLASQRKTRDELSEYYGLGETLTAVPRHLQRKFVKYGTMNHLLSEANAASISDCKDVDPAHTVANGKVFVDGLKVNPVFRFNVSYSVSDLSTDQAGNTVHLFTTPGSDTMQWLDVCIGGSNWLYYDKMNPNGSNPNTALVSNYRRAMSEERKGMDDSYNGWDDGLKGLHWAFVGDPYDFTIVNRRLSEDGSDNQWIVETKATIADYLGSLPNDSVIWTTSLKPDSTMLPASTPATSQAIASTATGATHFSTQMWKTGGDADYFLRTASLKSNADDFNNGSTTNTNQTNNYWRMVASVYAAPESYFEMVPFSLADKNVYNDNIYNGMYSATMKGLGITQQLLEIRTAVAKDEDNADNDCFDADVEVRNANGERVAFRENMEIKYGDVVASMPWTLRRYGCTYTCYIGYTTPTSHGTQLTRFRETATDYDTSVEPDITASEAEAQYNALYNAITTAKAGGTRVKLTYIYDVEPNVKSFFTTQEDTETEAYTWMNTYFGWEQPYSGSWQQVEHRETQFDHYVYNSAGQIIDAVYKENVWYTWEQGKGGTVSTKAYLNTVGGKSPVYAAASNQSDNEELKWSLVGDPYNFNMVNYAQYLNTIETGTPASVYLSGNDLLTSNSIPAQSFAMAIDKSGKTFLAVIDENGNILDCVDFEYSTASDKHLQAIVSTGINPDDPAGNTLITKNGSGTVKPFFIANLLQFADVVVYHLVMAHQYSLDAEDKQNWSTGTAGTITDQKTGYDTENNGSATGVYSRLLEFLKYWEKRDDNQYLSNSSVTPAQLQSDAESGNVTSFYGGLTGAEVVKRLLKEKGTLRNFLSYPVKDLESAKEGIGNHPQVPWSMKRQFCKYYLYQRDVMRSITTTEQATDSEGNLLWMDEAKTQPAYTIKWVSIFDQDYWSDWTDEDTENAKNDEELADRKVEVSTGVFKKAPKFYKQALAGQGEIIDKLLQCHENRKVLVDVVYEVNPDRFRFADKGRNTTAWYSMMTNNENDGLMNFSYLDGIGARLDRTHHYTNNYLWAPEGDPYGFVLRSRYATINGTGWDDVAVTTKGKLPKDRVNDVEKYIDGNGTVTDFAAPSTDDLLATYTGRATLSGDIPFNHKRIIHRRTGQDGATTDGATNAVYEMFEGSNSSSFLMHPTAAWMDVDDDSHQSYFLTHNTATNKTELTKGTTSTMLTNSDANWRLEATAEQLIPYFRRAGYVGGMDPVKAQAFSNLELYNRLQEYVDDPKQDRSFSTLKRAQEIIYSGTFYKSDGTSEVKADDPRPTGSDLPMKFVPDNLVNMKPGYYRIQAFSEDALNTDGEDLAGDKSNIKGIIGPRYISGYRFESEKTDPSDLKNNGGRWLHFFETDMQHSTIHTFADLKTKIDAADAHGVTDRDQFEHVAMRGNIEILPADFDASSIFQFTKTSSTTSGYEVYNLSTQGLKLWARPGTSEADASTGTHEFGRTELVESTPSAAEGYETVGINWADQFRLADIGGAAITLRTLKQETSNWDNDVAENLKTNYVCIDRYHRYRITCHTDNEMVEIGDHYTTDGLNGIQDTKWLLQPVGTKEDWPYNQMPLRVEVHKGGKQQRDLAKDDENYYGSLFVPFHTRLGRTTDAAFTLTSNPTSESVTMKAVSQINGMGNSQYVPAQWPVVLQTNKPGMVQLLNEGHTAESPSIYATRYYVNMYLPEEMQDVPLGDIKLQGQFLEQTLSTANNVMVFGLPYEHCSADGHTSTSTHSAHTPDETKAVGWYTNHNWARSADNAYNATATTATEDQRDNKYVYHNKVYYVATSSAREYIVALFDDGDEWQDDEPIDQDVTGTDAPWPCDVYDLAGRRVARNETPATLRRNHPQLLPGVYVFGGRKVVVR